MMKSAVLMVVAVQLSLTTATLYPMRQHVRHLRGGSLPGAEEDLTSILDEDGEAEETGEELSEESKSREPVKRVLSRDEIVSKLNHIPVFAIVNEEGHMVGLQDKEKDVFACCWFTDPDEAKALLEATKVNQPEKGLQLLVAGLGGAFAACGGWADGENAVDELMTNTNDAVQLRLQGSHGLCADLKPKLVSLLVEQGFETGCWQLPVFMSDKLQSRSICPVFIHPADLAATWEKAGKSADELPENLTVMEIRMLVKSMETDENMWDLVEFIGSVKARELAVEIQSAQPTEES